MKDDNLSWLRRGFWFALGAGGVYCIYSALNAIMGLVYLALL